MPPCIIGKNCKGDVRMALESVRSDMLCISPFLADELVERIREVFKVLNVNLQVIRFPWIVDFSFVKFGVRYRTTN